MSEYISEYHREKTKNGVEVHLNMMDVGNKEEKEFSNCGTASINYRIWVRIINISNMTFLKKVDEILELTKKEIENFKLVMNGVEISINEYRNYNNGKIYHNGRVISWVLSASAAINIKIVSSIVLEFIFDELFKAFDTVVPRSVRFILE